MKADYLLNGFLFGTPPCNFFPGAGAFCAPMHGGGSMSASDGNPDYQSAEYSSSFNCERGMRCELNTQDSTRFELKNIAVAASANLQEQIGARLGRVRIC